MDWWSGLASHAKRGRAARQEGFRPVQIVSLAVGFRRGLRLGGESCMALPMVVPVDLDGFGLNRLIAELTKIVEIGPLQSRRA